MKAIKVNADYESVLFQNKSLPQVNEALEFLALFVTDRPLLSKKSYSEEYLSYVEEKTGVKSVIKKEASSENWWGPLEDIELEKKLNSKEMSAELMIEKGWCKDSYIISSIDELPDLHGKTYLAKNPYGMSGQQFCKVESGRLENLERLLKNGKVILEPFFNRKFDFSHYVFSNGVDICYENIVDHKFQYRGTVFQDYSQPVVKNLPFSNLIEPSEWSKFESAFKEIKAHYKSGQGYSVDSFIYEEDSKLKIRILSEVNYRRTMGRVAFELALKFGGLRKWNAFVLVKSLNLSFSEIREKLKGIEWNIQASRGVVILSPGDVRYDMFFLSALNPREGEMLCKEFEAAFGVNPLEKT